MVKHNKKRMKGGGFRLGTFFDSRIRHSIQVQGKPQIPDINLKVQTYCCDSSSEENKAVLLKNERADVTFDDEGLAAENCEPSSSGWCDTGKSRHRCYDDYDKNQTNFTLKEYFLKKCKPLTDLGIASTGINLANKITQSQVPAPAPAGGKKSKRRKSKKTNKTQKRKSRK